MQEIPIQLDVISLILFVGIFLGFFVAYFLILKSFRKNLPNLIIGFFILSVSLAMLEGWLNYTGYIFKVLWLSNFAEPFNFIIAPLLYLFVISQFTKIKKSTYWLHFTPFGLWLGYCCCYFIQSDVFKYNSNIDVMQLNIPEVGVEQIVSDDPLGIRNYVNLLTGISFIIYNVLIIRLLIVKTKSLGQTLWNTTNKVLIPLRNSLYHFLVIIIIFIVVKLTFKNDVGDYFIFLYLSFMIFMTVIQIMNRSTYFNTVSTFLEGPVLKYKKSTLINEDKEIILEAIKHQMLQEQYFLSSMASLSGLAKSINESSHHVSQVINEKLNQSFFEMLATYRIEEAKKILKTELGKKLTIEEVAERVGYNSKSAFNTAFKKITSQTPSKFRDT